MTTEQPRDELLKKLAGDLSSLVSCSGMYGTKERVAERIADLIRFEVERFLLPPAKVSRASRS